jgi:hypothetical protein
LVSAATTFFDVPVELNLLDPGRGVQGLKIKIGVKILILRAKSAMGKKSFFRALLPK